MTYDEAVNCVTFYMAGWPSQEKMSNEAAALWIHDLEQLDHATAIRALDRLRHTEDYPPSLHKFLGAYQALAPRHYHEAIGGPKRFGHQAPLVAALRASIKAATKQEHRNHHLVPAKDCPVCSMHDHDAKGKHLSDCARCRDLGEMVYDTLRNAPSGVPANESEPTSG